MTKVSVPCCWIMVIWPFGPKTIDSEKVGVGETGITMVVGSGL
jgi:hypothetical protein